MAFQFDLYISGLVVVVPRPLDGMVSVLSVRAHLQPHLATLAYQTSALSGLQDQHLPAPDPLVIDANGGLFARRHLENEVLWLEPRFEDTDPGLVVNTGDLLSLSSMEPTVSSAAPSALAHHLEGSPAISRLDFAKGRLIVAQSSADVADSSAAQFEIRTPEETAGSGTVLASLATGLRLELEGLDSLVLHSNRRPALRFRGESLVRASYTNEPTGDFVPENHDPFPHLGMAYDATNVGAAEGGHHTADSRRRVFLTGSLTVSDRACPPTGI